MSGAAPASAGGSPASRRSRREARQTARQPERDEVAASLIAATRPHTQPSSERGASVAAQKDDASTATSPRAAGPRTAAQTPTAEPSTPRRSGGRRASGSSTDDIERPAGGRRAVVSTPTTAIPIITPEQAAAAKTPARITITPLDDVEVVRVPDVAAPAAPQTPLVPDLPSGADAGGTAPALPATTPVRRARRARTDAEGNVIVDPPIPAEPDPVVQAKRSKSGRRRASAPAGPPPGADQNPADQPPLSRRARRSTIVRVGVSTLGMLFAAGLAVGTSLPASVFSASALDSGMTIADVAPGLEGQALTTAADAGAASVARDGYSVTDLKQVAAASGIRMANTFVNDPTSAVQWPFPVGVPISDGFGPRESPGGIGSTDHKGVDFTPGQGTAIGSIADGVVSTVVPYDGGGLGVYVMIDHVIDGQKVTSVYGHMLTGSIEVEVGQAVKVGQQIGRVGNTGTSTGAHLHLEIRLNGTTPVDPYAFLEAHVGA
ncbi:M23 family metallopeptidase [Cnuibacter physcomitrellae]|uniref:M23 family metallopeptidase n=1 Tax=Cnuibacter physcomitrellae TaxID=1619308 RepID=UPI0012F4D072|nr:M23 family metallopeptidase [Cnuibacter physcomitrellae]